MPSPLPLAPIEFSREMEQGAVVIDTSAPAAFGGAHVKGSYSIWLEGLSLFAGWVLHYDKPILLVLEDQSHLEKAVRYLIRAGYDRIAGYLKNGIAGWYNAGLPAERLQLLTVHELKAKIDRGDQLTVLDVRGWDEWDAGHIESAQHIYVGHLHERQLDIPKDRPVIVICNVGHRAGLGASMLLRQGWREVYSVVGSMEAWKAAGYPVYTR